jgi:hypothetical protein
MSCLGVHFALSEEDVKALRAFDNEEGRLSHLQEDIEERYLADPGNYAAESDKSWDAMHRALADGRLSWEGGSYPLNHAVLAGELLYSANDYIMSLKTPSQVKEVAIALANMTEVDFRARYNAIPVKDYGQTLSEEDFGYTWEWFQGVRKLFQRAAKEDRYVLFTADQ